MSLSYLICANKMFCQIFFYFNKTEFFGNKKVFEKNNFLSKNFNYVKKHFAFSQCSINSLFIPSLEKPLTPLNYPHTHESALNFLNFTFNTHKFSNNLYFIILFIYLHLKVNIEKKNLK